jgi:hypothetical protein
MTEYHCLFDWWMECVAIAPMEFPRGRDWPLLCRMLWFVPATSVFLALCLLALPLMFWCLGKMTMEEMK